MTRTDDATDDAAAGSRPRVAVVTGAGRGMGFACARRLAPTVDRLVLVDRDDAGLEAAAADLARDDRADCADVVPLAADVADATMMAKVASTLDGGALRAVAHVAGVSPTMASWREILRVDLMGTAILLDVVSPHVEVGTAAVCFASMAALLVRDAAPEVDAVLDEPLAPGFLDELHAAAGPGLEEPGIAYAWAKRGVQRLVGRTAIDWGRRGGRICSISPGMIDTPMGRQEFAAQPVMAVLLEQTPLGREGTADEVAAVASFLLSDEASFVTGVDVLVDGGACAAVERSTGIPSPPT